MRISFFLFVFPVVALVSGALYLPCLLWSKRGCGKRSPGFHLVRYGASGLLLPLVFPGLRRFPKMALVVLATTVSIETFQFFIGRSADIDDVIMNLPGGLLGYAVFALLNRFLAPSPRWQRTLGIEE